MTEKSKDTIISPSYVRYSTAVLIGVIVILSSLATLVWVIDPFKRLATSDRDKAFCDKTAVGGPSAWFLKSIIFRDQKYDAIIVGSSKIHRLDPALFKYYRFVNGGVGAAQVELMYELLDAYAIHVKVVVLALDFLMFNEADFPYASEEQITDVRMHFRESLTPIDRSRNRAISLAATLIDDLPYLLSLKAVVKAVQMVGKAIPLEKRTLMPRGNLNISDWVDEMNKREKAGTRHVDRANYDSQLNVLRTQHYTPYIFSERRVEVLKKIRDLMAKRGIALIVQINPVNVEDKRLIDGLRITSDFKHYREVIKEVFPDAADFTGPEYADPKYYFDWDPIHFLPSTGAMLVNQELEKIVPEEMRQRYESDRIREDPPDSANINCE